MQRMKIPIGLIDPLQLRVNGEDPSHVADLREVISGGGTLPLPKAVEVNGRFLFWDGNHTVAAFRSLGVEEIEVEVYEGGMEEAYLLAAGANATHGLKRSNADKRAAVKALLKIEKYRSYSDLRLAEIAHVSSPLVKDVRDEMVQNGEIPPLETAIVERNGQTYTRQRRCNTVVSVPSDMPSEVAEVIDATDQNHQEAENDPVVSGDLEIEVAVTPQGNIPQFGSGDGLTDDVRTLFHLYRELSSAEQDCFLRLIGEPVEVDQAS